jgi:integrase
MSPISKDLSYSARKAIAVENQADRIKLINDDFKLSGILCRLRINKGSLFIRYQDLDSNRREISPPGCDLSPPGILTAQNMASLISQSLRLRNYSQQWLDQEIFHKTEKVLSIVLTVGTVRDEFPNRWLKYRSGDKESTNRQKLHTLTNYIQCLNRLIKSGKLLDDRAFDSTTIKLLIDLDPEGSDKRFRAKETLSIVCAIFGINYSFKGIGKRPKAMARELPNEIKIVETYNSMSYIKHANSISSTYYQWVFGILATYGLRPQEIAAIDKSKSFDPEFDNWLYLDGKLCSGIKTGNRIIPPLLPQWVELFNLKSCPNCPYSNDTDTQKKANAVADYFRIHKLGIRPYDLRHAYAIRTRRYMSLLDAANAMGHDVATHTKIYQRWISDTDRIASVRQGMKERGYL